MNKPAPMNKYCTNNLPDIGDIAPNKIIADAGSIDE